MTMDAVVASAALAPMTVMAVYGVRVLRRRSDERRGWSATRERDWTADELESLAEADLAV
jgi:hypothetical protein